MKYVVIGKQIHTLPYAIEVKDQTAAMKVDKGRPSFKPMFLIDFDNRQIQRLATDEDGRFRTVDDAFNEELGKHTTLEQMLKMRGETVE